MRVIWLENPNEREGGVSSHTLCRFKGGNKPTALRSVWIVLDEDNEADTPWRDHYLLTFSISDIPGPP